MGFENDKDTLISVKNDKKQILKVESESKWFETRHRAQRRVQGAQKHFMKVGNTCGGSERVQRLDNGQEWLLYDENTSWGTKIV